MWCALEPSKSTVIGTGTSEYAKTEIQTPKKIAPGCETNELDGVRQNHTSR